MGTDTKIDWADHTWNPWYGCTKVSPGCDNCYMFRERIRFGHNPEIVTRAAPKTFFLPKRECSLGRWRRGHTVFVCSWSDFFHPDADDLRPAVWNIIRDLPTLTFLILTKRPERISDHLPSDWGEGWRNVWLGVTAENQDAANRRLPWLLSIAAAKRFVSIEPMLGPVDLTRIEPMWAISPDLAARDDEYTPHLKWNALSHADGYNAAFSMHTGEKMALLDWVILGGESGALSEPVRPMHPDWARQVRDHCLGLGVTFWFKQWGEWHPNRGTGKLDPIRDLAPDLAGESSTPFVWLSLDGSTSQSGGTLADEALMLRKGRVYAGDYMDGSRWKGRPQ